MPSIPPSGSFLSLLDPANWEDDAPPTYDSDDDDLQQPQAQENRGPLAWPTFQALTGIMAPIFSPSPGPDTPSAWQSQDDNAAVWSFVTTFWSLAQTQKVNFVVRATKDNNARGRVLFLDWFRVEYRKWSVNQLILTSLLEASVDPYSTLKQQNGSTKMPHFEQAQAYLAYNSIAVTLFGPEAFQTAGQVLRHAVHRCVHELTLNYWHHQSGKVERELKRLDMLKAKVEKDWTDLSLQASRDDGELTMEDFRTWLKDASSLSSMLKRRGDSGSIALLRDQRVRLEGMLEALGVDTAKPRRNATQSVPKPLRCALALLATQCRVDLLTHTLTEELAILSTRGESSDTSTSERDLDAPDLDWSEGVEEYKSCTTDDLWNILGIPERSIPFFNPKHDPDSQCDPWTEEGEEWFENPSNGEPLVLRWHQLVGVVKMVENAFSGNPVLLMDGVGLGKTIQMAAFIAILAWYRDYFAKHARFPGKFKRRQWKGTSTNIDDLPSLIVVPPNLVDQLTIELHMYFQHGTFDLLPLLGLLPNREDWWTKHYTQCKNALGRRILITTPKASQSDFDAVLEADKTSPASPPRKQAVFAQKANATLFGYEYLVTIVDEAHQCRTLNRAFFTFLALMERSQCRVALSATPIISGPQDAWNLGRLLRITSFSSPAADEEYQKMDTKLRISLAKDRKRLRVLGTVEILVKGQAEDQIESVYTKEMHRAIDAIRTRFAGSIIRRSVQSVDHAGNRISGLGPYHEHFINVSLYPHEMDNLEAVAQDLVKDGKCKAQLPKASDFYLQVRRALIHPSCNPGYPWKNPSTIEEWNQDPSRKVDVLAEIVDWHLARDNRPPLRVVDDKLVPVDYPALMTTPESASSMEPDKLLIYCELPSAFTQIVRVLSLHNIKTLELHGKVSAPQRIAIRKKFKAATRDGPRVLIMSSVGLEGLNIPCANLLVKVTPNWSVQQDDQLIGRIYRPPQPKTVHVYNLIADRTQDVFLNHIAFSKAISIDAFTKTTPGMRTLFGKEAEDDDQESQAAERVHDVAKKAGCKNATLKSGEKPNGDEMPEVLNGGDDSRKTRKRKSIEEDEGKENGRPEASSGGDDSRRAKKRKRIEEEGKVIEKAVNENGRPGASSGGDDSRKTKRVEEDENGDDSRKTKKRKRIEKDGVIEDGDNSQKRKKMTPSKKDARKADSDGGLERQDGEGDGNGSKRMVKKKRSGKNEDSREVKKTEDETPRGEGNDRDGNCNGGSSEKKLKRIKKAQGVKVDSSGEVDGDRLEKTKKRKRRDEGDKEIERRSEEEKPAVIKKPKSKNVKKSKSSLSDSNPGSGALQTLSFENLLDSPNFSDIAHKIGQKK